MTTPPTSSVEAASNRPVAPLPFERRRAHGVTCVVESCQRMRLTGWALVQPWQPAAIELRQGTRVLSVQVLRLHRSDVLSHLGADPQMELSLGFTLELPPEVWEQRSADGSIRVHLSVDGTDADMPSVRLSVEHLEEWQQSLLWSKEPASMPAEWARLSQHLRFHLSPEQLQAADDQIEQTRATLMAQASQQAAPLRWAVEEVSEFRVTGWAVLLRGGEERFEVACNGQLLAAHAVRYERSDVQHALGAVKLESGFELSVPPEIWQHVAPGRTAYVQVLIAGHPVLEQVIPLSTAHLGRIVSRWRESGGQLSDNSAEHRHQTLTLIEHLRASGLLSALPADDLKFLADAAAAEGVNLAIPLSARIDPLHLAVARELWHLQRTLNGHISSRPLGAEMLEAALEQTLAELREQVSSASVDRFLVSLIPTFCAQDALALLRPRLPQHELDTLASSHGRWELSMLVPVAVMDELASEEGRLVATSHLLEKLSCTSDQGWIESAALRDAWRRLASSTVVSAMDDEDVQRVLQWTLQFFASMGSGPASRLHDENLIGGMHEVITLAMRLGQRSSLAACAAALRHYGLCPQFWNPSSDQTLPGQLTEEPYVLRSARSGFQRLMAGLAGLQTGQPDALDTCSRAIATLRELGCGDIDTFHRHAVLAHADTAAPDPGQALQLLQGLHPHEALRWMCRAPEQAVAPWPEDELSRVMLVAAPAPPVPNVALRQALTGAAGGRFRAATALCGESHGFIGLLWLAQQAHHGSEGAAQAIVPALQRALSVCERHRPAYPNPPAALCSVLSWACRPGATTNVTGQADTEDLKTLEARARELWPLLGSPQALPGAPVINVAVPGVDTLVVVKWRAPHGEDAASGVARSWGHALVQAGTPWVLWQAQPGPVGFTDSATVGARGRVHAPTLVALLSWLVEHSDFGHVLLVEDDVILDVQAWRDLSGGPSHHYHGAALLSPLGIKTGALDKSPRGTRFASSEHGLALSRFAAERAMQLGTTARGARLARDSFDEEKYLADLLSLADIELSEEGHVVHPCRTPRADLHAFGYQSYYPPAPGLPTVLTHHVAAGTSTSTRTEESAAQLSPRRLWPTDRTPSHDNHGQALALVELSAPAKAEALREAPCVVVAAARNERVLLPHFLAHYRGLGVRHFVIVDNLSTDGSREFLLEQPDVVVYSADSPYSLSRYGVTWQQSVLAAHALGRWALVADIDEFLVWPGCETETLPALCTRISGTGASAARVLMIDMYPEGALRDADFAVSGPFDAADCFDAKAVVRWELGSGSYSNSPTWVSGLRHRLLPDSAPNHYTSQKVALMQYMPWVRCSEGLHYAAGLTVATELLAFAHFKFHSGFHAKVLEEVQRAEHYNAAEEYRQYQALLNTNAGSFFDPLHSRRYTDSHSFIELLK